MRIWEFWLKSAYALKLFMIPLNRVVYMLLFKIYANIKTTYFWKIGKSIERFIIIQVINQLYKNNFINIIKLKIFLFKMFIDFKNYLMMVQRNLSNNCKETHKCNKDGILIRLKVIAFLLKINLTVIVIKNEKTINSNKNIQYIL